jgi:hypothetical protein
MTTKGDVGSIRIEDLVGSLQTFEASFAKPKKRLALKACKGKGKKKVVESFE